MWPTPLKEQGAGLDSHGNHKLPAAVHLWPTPIQHDKKIGQSKRLDKKRGMGGCSNLNDTVTLWPTVLTGKGGQTCRGGERKGELLLTGAIATLPGESGPLNPVFAEWLMGWPMGWTSAEPMDPKTFQAWLQKTDPWSDAVLMTCRDGKVRAAPPDIHGMCQYGMPNRIVRVAAIGDGQVPIVVASAFQILLRAALDLISRR